MIGMSLVLPWPDPNSSYRQFPRDPFETIEPVYEERFERR
jgi:hypothetical protein